ncbi:hypothetical protein DRN43_07175 [Thermococci archaeon]|nr:MAG: hypothetical protein DRN43_07175 [Thermococci archaeon]
MRAKREALASLFMALRERRVDEDITDLLMLINSIRGIHTTSSCSGRIGILEEPYLGSKPLSRWLIKKHSPITFEEAKEALGNAREGMIFLKSQPPIFHVVAQDIKTAKRIHEVGLASGFKYTTFRALKGDKVLVEINGTEYLTAPLGKNGKVLSTDEHLAFTIEMGNEMLRRSKGRLPRLRENFEKLRGEFGEDDLFHEIKSKLGRG